MAARRAAALWGWVTIGGMAVLAALVLWHLVRRGRLLQTRSVLVRREAWPEEVGNAESPPPPRETP